MSDENKPKLSDVIGGLVASMVHARTVADMEALRIAHLYRQNEFLTGLPIPRLRLQKVSISLPVVLTDVLHGQIAKAEHPQEIAEAVYDALSEALNDALRKAGRDRSSASLTPEARDTLDRMIRLLSHAQERSDELGTPLDLAHRIDTALRGINVDTTDEKSAPSDVSIRMCVGDQVQQHFTDMVRDNAFHYADQRADQRKVEFDYDRAQKWVESEVLPSPYMQLVLSRLRAKGEETAVLRPTIAPDFEVTVNTDAVKMAGGGIDNVTRLNLVLHEEGLEWVRESGEGGETTRLTSE
jgi:hypothetical protein